MKTAIFIAALLFALGAQASKDHLAHGSPRVPPPTEQPPAGQPSSNTNVSAGDEGKSRRKQYLWLGAAALGAYFIWSWDKPASEPAVQFGVRVHEGGK